MAYSVKPVSTPIANVYLHDNGIEKDPDVLLVEKFDDPLPVICSRYTDVLNKAGMSQDADVPAGNAGPYSLKITNTGGSNDGGHLFRNFEPGFDSIVYLRYYVKYPLVSKGFIHHESVWFDGTIRLRPGPIQRPAAAVSTAVYLLHTNRRTPRAQWILTCTGAAYTVTMMAALAMAMRLSGAARLAKASPWDKWICVEMMIKLNTPATAFNGELRIWQDGVEVGHRGPAFRIANG